MDKGNKTNKKIHFVILSIVIVIAAYVGINSNENFLLEMKDTQKVDDPYGLFRSDNQHQERESEIKAAFDEYMGFNFYQIHKTTWFDSVSATSAVINEHGTIFAIQSKSAEYDKQAENFLGAAGYFFNDKTLESKYKIDRLILVDQEFEMLKEIDVIKW